METADERNCRTMLPFLLIHHSYRKTMKKAQSPTSRKATDSPASFTSAPPRPALSPSPTQPRTPRPSPANSPLPPALPPPVLTEGEIEVTFAFLDAYHDTGRLTLSTLQRRLGPLLFPASAAGGKNNTPSTSSGNDRARPLLKAQETFFRSLLPHATAFNTDDEPSLTLSELKALLLADAPTGGPPPTYAQIKEEERKKNPLEVAFSYLDHEGTGALNPTLLVNMLQKLEGLSLGEGAAAMLLCAADLNGDGLINLKDFKKLKGVVSEKDEEN